MNIDQLQSIALMVFAVFGIATTLVARRAFDILDALADASRSQNEAIDHLRRALTDHQQALDALTGAQASDGKGEGR